ncbi:MAG: hypothetical protein ABR613_06760 [Actinomycetota bacterium]
MSMISAEERTKELLEVLWVAERQYGELLEAPDQVAIARSLAIVPVTELGVNNIEAAFKELGLSPPPRGYSNLVVSRSRRVRRPAGLVDELLEFRQFAIGNLSRQHGGKTKGNEDRLRDALLTYLRRGYAEAHTGRGQTDILIPKPEDAIIEVKVWTTLRTYEDGLTELGRYIHTSRPKQAAFVVFGDRTPLPSIVRDHNQAIAEVRELEDLQVPVVVVPFEIDPPTKAAANERRRKRVCGR